MKYKCMLPVVCFSHNGKDFIIHKNDEVELPEDSEHVKTLNSLGHILPVRASNPKTKK